MIPQQRHYAGYHPAITRLSRLAPLAAAEVERLSGAIAGPDIVRQHREVQSDGQPIAGPRLLVGGWAARVRQLADGRRQFLSFVLPGDLIGLSDQPTPVAVSTIIALTEVRLSPAPEAQRDSSLGRAYAISRALDEAYLLAQIVRLGRYNAQERIADLFLELYERLSLADMVTRDSFDFPVTQETLADVVGLTSVHVNRMVQALRRQDDIEWQGKQLTIRDPAGLARRVGRNSPRVTAGD